MKFNNDQLHLVRPDQECSNYRAPRFGLGTLVISSHLLGIVLPDQLVSALRKHAAGDWGHLDSREIAANEIALCRRDPVCSLHRISHRRALWIGTNFQRGTTTVLLFQKTTTKKSNSTDASPQGFEEGTIH